MGKRILGVLLGFILISAALKAGNEPTLQDLQNKYKDEHAIYLSESEHVTIKTKGNEYEIYNDVNWRMMYLTDKGKGYGKQSINFSKFSAIENIKAFAYLPKNGNPDRLKKQRITDFKTEDVFDGSYFYHDNKKISIDFPGTDPGTQISLSYREIIKNPKFMGSAFLASYVPTLNSSYSITYPKNVTVIVKMFNTENLEIEHTKNEKGKNITETWRVVDQDPYESVGGAPSLRHYAPHIIARIGEIQLKDSTVSVLPNLDGLYNWYYSLVKDVNAETDSSLKAITEEVIKDKEGKDEKARAIFNWVQDNIKYIAFEDGMGGFIPRPAAKVCRNRYGDCKDMSSIITDMLRYANIEGNITWVGSREIPYTYTDVPTPAVDNHMIASYRNEKNEVVILDAVGTYTPYGFPTEFIQGKQCLISKGPDNYEVYKIPEISKEDNREMDFLSMKLKDGKLVGNGTLNAFGYSKFDYVYRLINMSNKEEKRDYLESVWEKGSNKFRLDDIKIHGLNNRDTSLSIDYSFNLEDYSKTVSGETYVNMHLDKDFAGSTLDIKERKGIALIFDYKYINGYEVQLKIPKNNKVTYLPPNVSYTENEEFGFFITYENKNGVITLKKEVYINTLILDADQFERWNKMIKQLKKAYKEVVVLSE